MTPRPPRAAPPKPGSAPDLNRLLIIAGSVAIVVLLSLVVIVASLVMPGGGRTTIAIPPTDTPPPTFTPTATLGTVPAPVIAQFQTADGSGCTPQQFQAYVLDPTTGRVLLARNADRSQPIASTTKIMTAFVVLFYGYDLDQKITITSAMYYNDIAPLLNEQAQFMGISGPGEVYTLRDLMYGLLVKSGDDAAVAIADGLLGSQATFVARMNDVATWLGLAHTHYVNSHGLDLSDPHNDSSASDLAKLAEVAMELPTFRQIVATPIYTIAANTTHGALKLTSTNILLTGGTNLGVDGVKTGYTGCNGGAGECVVLHAQLNGHQLIVVVLGDGNGNERFIDGARLLAWGFQEEGITSAKVPAISLTPTPEST